MNRVYDDEDNEPMDESMMGRDLYGILHEICIAAKTTREIDAETEGMSRE